MGQGQGKYEKEYKVQAVKLAQEIGAGKAAKELGIPVNTLYGWQNTLSNTERFLNSKNNLTALPAFLCFST